MRERAVRRRFARLATVASAAVVGLLVSWIPHEAPSEGLPAGAERLDLTCETSGDDTFRLVLWSPSYFGGFEHCIDPLLTYRGPICAPQGGWSFPGVVAEFQPNWTTDPREARRAHDEQAKLFASAGPSLFVASYATGGMPLALEVSGSTVWRLVLALGTLEGATFDAGGRTAFVCTAG